MTAQDFLMLINSSVQVALNNTEIFQILLFFFAEAAYIDVLFFQFLYPASHQFPVFLEFFLCVTDRIQILQKDFLVILY